MLGWLLRWRDLIFFCLGLMPLHGGGYVYVVVCEYAHVVVTMLSVWQEHTASVCEAYWTIAVDSCTLVYF